MRRQDRRGRFELTAYQDAPSPPMTPELREACERAVHVVTVEGRMLSAGRASLFVLEGIGFAWLAVWLRLPPAIWIVEVAYRIVASNRTFFAKFLFRPGA